MKHFVSILDHSADELEIILQRSADLKSRRRAGIHDRIMMGMNLGMYFEKPSLRTRVSLESAMVSMGGGAINLDIRGKPLGERESIKDQALVMSRYVDLISIRTFSHNVVETLAEWSSVPVINALSDYNHPTQAMADILTYREHVRNPGVGRLTYVGDGNNVARSLVSICAILAIPFTAASPKGYELDPDFMAIVKKLKPAADIAVTNDPYAAVKDAAIIYTDVWTSMGQEDEAAERRNIFLPYQVNSDLLAQAPDDVRVMHCLPAHRGDEITDEVMDSSVAIVYDQAENRMHINRGLFAVLTGR